MFPEIVYDRIDQIRGMDKSLVLSSCDSCGCPGHKPFVTGSIEDSPREVGTNLDTTTLLPFFTAQ